MQIYHGGRAVRTMVARVLHPGPSESAPEAFSVPRESTETPQWLLMRRWPARFLVEDPRDPVADRYQPLVRSTDGAVANIDLFLHADEPRRTEHELAMFRRADAPPSAPGLSIQGLASVPMSGSAEFTTLGLTRLSETLQGKNVYVMDLREESHCFANGVPVSRFTPGNAVNEARPLSWIMQDEYHFAGECQQAGRVAFKNEFHGAQETGWAGVAMNVRQVATEQELVEGAGMHYNRYNVTDEHAPRPEVVDRFVEDVRNLPADAWLHFHCVGGKGRTTTFMAMFDMMHNAKGVSFEDILRRQKAMGGADLTNEHPLDNAERQAAVQQQHDFLKSFYQYCRSNEDGFMTSYSTWVSKQPTV
ncbi:MAG TPA: hypothetical protein VGO93_06385 [Candidatus Xenobia bacterium]|jgi:protein-tyrosine phosphatase